MSSPYWLFAILGVLIVVLIVSEVSRLGGIAMKSFHTVLGMVLGLLLLIPATGLSDGEGRYQAITIFRGSAPMVFILDTKNGNSWLWQKGSFTNETGVREEWSTLYYQGRMTPGKEGAPGELVSAPRWRLPDRQ